MKERKTINQACFYDRDYKKEIASFASDILNPDCDDQLSEKRFILVQAMRKRITANEAKCLELSYGKGLTTREISVQLDISPHKLSRIVPKCEEKISDILSLGLELLGEKLFQE